MIPRANSIKIQLMTALNDISFRQKYMLYDRSEEKIDIVMQLLDNKHYVYGDGKLISMKTGIPTSTLSDWRRRKMTDANFNPLDKRTNIYKRIFTDEEEEDITEYILENIIKPGILFTNYDFKNLIMDAFNEKFLYEDDYSKIPQFNASDGFVTDFKNRNNFVSRRLHAARRPLNTSFDTIFTEQMKNLFEKVEPKYIVNIDETSWEVVPKIFKSWHIKGHDHVLRYIQANPKDRITVMAGIRADGIKLPLQFLAAGRTEKVLNTQIGDVNYHFGSYSENGWCTKETFKDYLIGIREFYNFCEETIHVICDGYKAHISDEVIEFAHLNNIQLYFIPHGFTDQLQPLDVKIFGILKSTARRLFMDRYRQNPYQKRSKLDACQDMVYAWEKIDMETIKQSFEQLKILQ